MLASVLQFTLYGIIVLYAALVIVHKLTVTAASLLSLASSCAILFHSIYKIIRVDKIENIHME